MARKEGKRQKKGNHDKSARIRKWSYKNKTQDQWGMSQTARGNKKRQKANQNKREKANEIKTAAIGTRSRIQRSIRIDQRQSRSMDLDSTGRLGHHMRMATFSLAIFLHQAEVDLREKLEGKKAMFMEEKMCKRGLAGCMRCAWCLGLIDHWLDYAWGFLFYLSSRTKDVPMFSFLSFKR